VKFSLFVGEHARFRLLAILPELLSRGSLQEAPITDGVLMVYKTYKTNGVL
jgi:hypothetical protein